MSEAVRLYAGTQDGVHVWRQTHGGFEAVTYMLEGGFHHRDNLGNDSIVMAGTAASIENLFLGLESW